MRSPASRQLCLLLELFYWQWPKRWAGKTLNWFRSLGNDWLLCWRAWINLFHIRYSDFIHWWTIQSFIPRGTSALRFLKHPRSSALLDFCGESAPSSFSTEAGSSCTQADGARMKVTYRCSKENPDNVLGYMATWRHKMVHSVERLFYLLNYKKGWFWASISTCGFFLTLILT